MSENPMVYVAADPSQPGSAWAAAVDISECADETADSIAQWVRDGANVMRVDLDTAREMLSKWQRPVKTT